MLGDDNSVWQNIGDGKGFMRIDLPAHFAPPAPEPSALKPGCGKMVDGSFCGDVVFGGDIIRCAECSPPMPDLPDPDEPPAQAATEVTHEEARTLAHDISRAAAALATVPVLKKNLRAGGDDLLRYIDQQSRRDAEAKAKIADLTRELEVRGEESQYDMGFEDGWNKRDSHARDAVAQAAPRVEGGMRERAHALSLDLDCCSFEESGVHTCDCEKMGALLEQVAAEARASALPPGAAELLSDWRAVSPEHQGATINHLHMRADGIAARLLRALATKPRAGGEGE